MIDQILKTFDIQRSLSKKGCPYDNAVAESTSKSFKVEFVYSNTFRTERELSTELFDYVNWWNNWCLHGSLGIRHQELIKKKLAKLALRVSTNMLMFYERWTFLQLNPIETVSHLWRLTVKDNRITNRWKRHLKKFV